MNTVSPPPLPKKQLDCWVVPRDSKHDPERTLVRNRGSPCALCGDRLTSFLANEFQAALVESKNVVWMEGEVWPPELQLNRYASQRLGWKARPADRETTS